MSKCQYSLYTRETFCQGVVFDDIDDDGTPIGIKISTKSISHLHKYNGNAQKDLKSKGFTQEGWIDGEGIDYVPC